MKKVYSLLLGLFLVFAVAGNASALTMEYVGEITSTNHNLHSVGDKLWLSLTDVDADSIWDSMFIKAEYANGFYTRTSNNISETTTNSNIWDAYDDEDIRLWTINLSAVPQTIFYDYQYNSPGMTYTADLAPVPEPATMLLFGLGLLGLAGINRKKQ